MSPLASLDVRVIEPAFGHLDKARAALLRATSPVTRSFVRSRDLRVIATLASSVGLALALAVCATGTLLLLGPLVFGVAHLAVEARYLLPASHRKNRALLLVLAAQTVLSFMGLAVYALPFSAAAAVALTSSAPGAGKRGELHRCGIPLALAASIGVVAVAPTWSRFALLHLHNLVPLAMVLGLRRRPRAASVVAALLVVSALLGVLFGAFDGVAVHTPLADRVFSLNKLADTVGGGFAQPYRKRLLIAFAFTQSFHYATWLRVVPEVARERETPRPWLASWQAYKSDAGAWFARMSLVVTLLVPLAAVVIGVVRARSFYVTASEFHASVEAVLVLALFAARRSGGGGDTVS